MIYTLTFSPALDYIVDLDTFNIGKINRVNKEKILIGGKGINVSIVLSSLGEKSITLGFIGGFTGRYIEEELQKLGVGTDFISVLENNRINIKIKNNEIETSINGNGPNISNEDINKLLLKLDKLDSNDVLIISGSIPSNLPSNTYEKILKRINKEVNVIIDTTKDNLLNTLFYKPFLVKPNKEELEEMFNVKINNDDELIVYAKKLIDLGSKNVIVSLGKDGALLVTKEGIILKLPSPKGKVISTVGAGDSLVAGFIYEYLKTKDVVLSFKKGIACGSASVFSNGLLTKKMVDELFNQIEG